MKSRDITEDEINKITNECKIREKAFFTIMRQSGLPPHTIKQLKIKNLEKILDPNTPTPCKIEIPNEKFPIFIGEEAVQHLKQYLKNRANKETLTPASLLFTAKNNPNKEINTKDVSRAFARTAQKLKKQKKINYKTEYGKPNELRLFSLIRFYKIKAKDYLSELRNNNTSKDNESYRKRYEEKAMPSLEIEPTTPIEMQQLKKEIAIMKQTREKLQVFFNWIESYPTKEQMMEELGINKEYNKNDILHELTPEEVATQMEEADARWERLEKEKRLQTTNEKHEPKRKRENNST
jgi:hypothetical protein